MKPNLGVAVNFMAMIICFGAFLMDIINKESSLAVIMLILASLNGFMFISNLRD